MGLEEILPQIGYLGIFAIIFAESGLFFGFFFPGDSLLFTAGFLASQGVFEIKILALLCFIAAVLGDSVGYWFGKKVGPRLFNRENSLFFHKENLIKAKGFYEKHGGKTIVLARFMPFIRTFAPIVAGIGEMKYSAFLSFNIIGGLGWAVGISALGYFLGVKVGNVDKYLLPIILLIVFVSVLPGIWHILKDPIERKKVIGLFVNLWMRFRKALNLED